MKKKIFLIAMCVILSSCAAPASLEPGEITVLVSADNSKEYIRAAVEAVATPEVPLPVIRKVSENASRSLTHLDNGDPLVPFTEPGADGLYGLCGIDGAIVVYPVYTSIKRIYYDDSNYVYALVKPLDGSDEQLVISTPGAEYVYGPFQNTVVSDAYSDVGKGFIRLTRDRGSELLVVGEGIFAGGDSIGVMSGGLAPVGENGLYGFIGIDGRYALRSSYQNALGFFNGYAAVCENGLWGIIDTNGEWSVPPTYQDAKNTSGGVCAVRVEGGAWGLIDIHGESLFPFEYEEIKKPDEYMCVLSRNGERFYYDAQTGKVTNDDETLKYLRDGVFAYVGTDRVKLVFERSGTSETIVGAGDISAVGNGYFEVVINSKKALYKAGEGYIYQPKIAELVMPYIEDGTLVVSDENGKLGVYSLDGSQLLPFEYNVVNSLGFGLFWVENNMNSGIIDEYGDWKLRF